MNNKECGDLINDGVYPDDINVPLDTPFIDNRGIIQNLWLSQSGSVTFIESKPGAIRARHKHIGDWHSTYVISGKIKYTELENDEKTVKREVIFNPGDMFFTKPDVFHIMEFVEDTKMITINNIVKNHENYIKSIERME
jgi:quercetin dioxygenase-like cupin family protein